MKHPCGIGAALAAAALATLWTFAAEAQILAPSRARTLEQPAVLKPLSPAALPAASPEVKSAEPLAVAVEPGGASITVVLRGSGLDKITMAEILQNGAVIRELEAKPGGPAATERPVAIRAAAQAAVGTYQLRIGDGTKKALVPLNILKIEVKARIVAVAPRTIAPVVKTPLPGTVLPKETMPPPPAPVTVAPKPPVLPRETPPDAAPVAPKVTIPKTPLAVLPKPGTWATTSKSAPADAAAPKPAVPPVLKGEVRRPLPVLIKPADKADVPDGKKPADVLPRPPAKAPAARTPVAPAVKLPDAVKRMAPQTLASKLPVAARPREPLSAAPVQRLAGATAPKAPLPEPQPRITGFDPQATTVVPCGLATVKFTGMLLDKITSARVVLRTGAAGGGPAPALTARLKPPAADPHLALYVDISADCSAAPSRAVSPSYYVLELSAGSSRVGDDLRITVPGEAAPRQAVAPLPVQTLPMRPPDIQRPVVPSRPPEQAKADRPAPAASAKKGSAGEAPPPPVIGKVDPGAVELEACASASVRLTGQNLNRVTSARVVKAGRGSAPPAAAEGFETSILRPSNAGEMLYARLSMDCGTKKASAGDRYSLEFYADEVLVGDAVPVSVRRETRVAKADPVPLQLSPCDAGIVHISGSNLSDITDARPAKLSFPDEVVTTLSPGNEARDLRVQVSCKARAGITGSYLLQLYAGEKPLMDLPLVVKTPACPDGRFNALGRFRDCVCPSGFKVGIDSEGMAQCLPDAAAGYCPVGNWFCTGDGPACERPDCACPPGYHAENRPGAYKICAGSRCPREKWFDTAGQWRGCSCDGGKGLNKRYRKLNAEAICTVADIDNEALPASPDELAADPAYRLYQGFFSIAGAGAALMPLPQSVQDALRPHFIAGTVELAQYGSSLYALNGTALTDCLTIYFPAGQGVADDLASGRILSTQNLRVLLHELAHVEQCISAHRGNRSSYAREWFGRLPEQMQGKLEEAIRRLDLGRLSARELHARMPMEPEAEARASETASQLASP